MGLHSTESENFSRYSGMGSSRESRKLGTQLSSGAGNKGCLTPWIPSAELAGERNDAFSLSLKSKLWKNRTRTLLYTIHKKWIQNSFRIKVLNGKTKLVRENIIIKLLWYQLVNRFSDMAPKIQVTIIYKDELCQNLKHVCFKEYYQGLSG